MLRHILRWLIPLVGTILVGIVKYARIALPILAILAGYLYYKSRPPSAYSSPEEEAAWNDVLGHGKWKSYDEKIAAMKKEREEKEKSKAASVHSTVQQPPSPFDPATAPKMTMTFDMAIPIGEDRIYFRENPKSMKADFLVLCVPHMIAELKPDTPDNRKLVSYYERLVADIANDVATPKGWSNRVIRQRRWVVVFADPYKRFYPSLRYDDVGSPPVGNQVCDTNHDMTNEWFSFTRHYFKIGNAP